MGGGGDSGGCFNKHNRPSGRATDHSGMMVRRSVGQSIMFIETAPMVLEKAGPSEFPNWQEQTQGVKPPNPRPPPPPPLSGLSEYTWAFNPQS